MSLRARLALVLAASLLLPVLVAAVLAVMVPRTLAAGGRAEVSRDAAAISTSLAARCDGIADTAAAVARDVAAGGTLIGPVADAFTRRAADRRPGTVVVVLDKAGRATSSAGITPTQATRAAWFARQSSCALAVPAPEGMQAVLAENTPVSVNGVGIATVVAWAPLDDAVLRDLRETLAVRADLVLLTASSRESSAVPPNAIAASTAPRSDMRPLVQAALDGGTAGSVGRHRYVVRDAEPGVPYAVLAISPAPGGSWQLWVAGGALAGLVIAAIAAWLLSGRLTRGVADVAAAGRLQRALSDLRRQQDAVSETFDSFGAALGHTHDLERLLEAVLGAAVHGADAVAGVVLLAEPPVPDGLAPDPQRLQERARAVRPGTAGADTAADALFPLALLAVERGAPATDQEVAGPGAALALPLRDGSRIVGALAVVRAPDAPAIEGAAADRVRALTAHAGTAIGNVRMHEETRRMSVTDPLTGVGNVRMLSTTLSREVGRAGRFSHPLSVLMLDLDHFKAVNDEWGHACGDLVLCEFAERLSGCVREVDTVARYGGEEFAVILPETDITGAMRVAERVLEAMRAEPFRAGDRSRRVTVSVGLAAFPAHGRSATELLQSADAALYAAKRGGRDRWRAAGPPHAGAAGASTTSEAGVPAARTAPVADPAEVAAGTAVVQQAR